MSTDHDADRLGVYAKDTVSGEYISFTGNMSVMLLCEAAVYYKMQKKTLWNAMLTMYDKYGYYREGLLTWTLKGFDERRSIS